MCGIDKSLGMCYDGEDGEVISTIAQVNAIDAERYRDMLAEKGRKL